MTAWENHAALIGQQGSRHDLNTPALIIDKPALERNIARMSAFAEENSVALRPHAKTHKSLDIAKLQKDAGAVGICCAKLGEAEALTESGAIKSVLITSPVVSPQAIKRLTALHARVAGLMVVVDHVSNVAALARAVSGDQPLGLLIDIDPGIHRTGVPSAEAAIAVAQEIAKHDTLHLRGVQFYCGIQQHIESFEQRRDAIIERTGYLRGIIAELTQAGFTPDIISGGGTGTHFIDVEMGLFTELQVGSYVFMDTQYGACQLTESGDDFEAALLMDARIVSCNTPGLATVDAGFKALSTDGGLPRVVGGGAPENAAFIFMGDEHGGVIASDYDFELAHLVSLQVPHCDPTVNLHDAYHVVEGDTLIDIWPVTARGRSR